MPIAFSSQFPDRRRESNGALQRAGCDGCDPSASYAILLQFNPRPNRKVIDSPILQRGDRMRYSKTR